MNEKKNAEILSKGRIVEMLLEARPQDFPSKAAAERTVAGVFQLMSDALAEGRPVQIDKFGSFRSVLGGARNVTNPRTKEKMQVDPKMRVKFTAFGALKDTVQGEEA